MGEVFNYLNKYQDQPPKVIKIRIKSYFGLSEKETEEVYNKWKAMYMKPKVDSVREGKKND